jgi:hypothetical protein
MIYTLKTAPQSSLGQLWPPAPISPAEPTPPTAKNIALKQRGLAALRK